MYSGEGLGCAHAGVQGFGLVVCACRPAAGDVRTRRVHGLVALVIECHGLAVAVLVLLHVRA